MAGMQVVGIARLDRSEELKLPLFLSPVQAGFPSPAEDYIERRLDLNDLVVQHPTATFFVKVEGESMEEANIFTGDILVVDRSLEPAHNKIVVAVVNGEFTVKRLSIESQGVFLLPENPKYRAIKITSAMDFQIWGTVTYVIHKAA